MSGLFTAMAIVKATFDKYAGKDGDKTTLTKAELSDLLKAEFFEGKVSRTDGALFQQRAVNATLT